MESRQVYRVSAEETLKSLSSKEEGLESAEAQRRLEEYGANRLEEKKRASLLILFLRQLKNPLVFILLFAVGFKFFLGSYLEANVILATVLLMVSVSFAQEAKAEASIQALRKLSAPKSRVRRGGRVESIPSEEVVPGDLLLLEAGDRISVDGRILRCNRLQVNESSLTGESLPSEKVSEAIEEEVGLGDRKNMVFTGTVVTQGKASVVVSATGMETELGKIAGQLKQGEKEETPLQKGIHRFANGMLLLILLFIGITTFLGWKVGMSWVEILLLDISMAVAAIPEGLPAVVTLVLASGVQILSKKNALIRRLIAVETLGSASVICSDKTGTLTKNHMQMVEIRDERSEEMHRCLILCNDAHETNGKWVGDAVDVAILEWADQNGIDRDAITETSTRVNEIPFASENGWMATLDREEEGHTLHVKGAPEKLLSACSELNEEKWSNLAEEMAERGLKVLALCMKQLSSSALREEDVQEGLTFLGLIGLMDPPREEVKLAVEQCHEAGIEVVMVTGDHAVTARSIASQVGIKPSRTVVGKELEHLQEEELQKVVSESTVFARIEPIHKMKITEAIKASGRVVAMTGDGVNDAPALESANIGIAMGKSGTEVAKEASDMVLTDDRFETIVVAIEEGRLLFNRLRHVTSFLLSTCFGEVFVILLGFALLQTAPLEPLQILWINLVTGSMIALPLGTEPKVGNELTYPPRDPKVGLIFRGMALRIAAIAFFLGLGTFLVFRYELMNRGIEEARSAAFCTIILFEWLVSWQFRSDESPLRKLKSNRNLLIANTLSLGLFLLVLYVPALEKIFATRPLGPYDWLLCSLPGVFIFFLESLRKKWAPKLFSKGKWKKGKTH